MDQSAQRAFVEAKTCSPVEAPQAGPAGRADTMLVQRKLVGERRMAGGAEVVCLQRLRSRQALGTNRDTRPARQRALANTAIVGKKE
jgi:hypothetical protein